MMGADRRTRITAALAFTGLCCTAGALAGDQPDWDRVAAATYLDARAAEWAAFAGADRGEGADKVSCLSCHTSVPFALARSVLRPAAANEGPTAGEERLLKNVRLRVAHWKDLDTPRFRLSYDFDEKKKVESWGTEAVLNALVLAFDDRRRGLHAPSDSTRDALRHLWEKQLVDGPEQGAWDWLNFGLHPWEPGEVPHYFGATLAAIAVGTAPGYLDAKEDPKVGERVERLRRFIRERFEKQNVHNLIWTLWAATAVDGILTADQRRQIIDRVFEKQQDNGGWSLASLATTKQREGTPQEPGPDGYATGLTLHVLQLAGLPKDHPSVARGLAWLCSNQQKSGAWVSNSLNKKRDPKSFTGKFMSDAATAYAVLALCHD